MTRKVECILHKENLDGLDQPPFPGDAGDWVFENVSQQAWSEWQQRQIRLINEKQLVLRKAETREYLQQQMVAFFKGEEADEADGYIAPDA